MIYNVFHVRDENGQVAGYATVSRNITERKLAEESLHDRENRYELVLAGAGAAIWDWDSATQSAVIPSVVKQACLVEADEILQDLRGQSQRWRRLDEQHQGVTYDRAGAAAEAYRKGTPAFGRCGLSRRAFELLSRYRLRSGRLA